MLQNPSIHTQCRSLEAHLTSPEEVRDLFWCPEAQGWCSHTRCPRKATQDAVTVISWCSQYFGPDKRI